MIDAIVFDLGNTLFAYRDYGLEAYAARLHTAVDRILQRWNEAGEATPIDGHGLARRVFDDMLATEHQARESLTEFDASTQMRFALAQHIPAMGESWDAPIDEIVYGIMRDLYEPAPGAVSALRGLKGMGLKTGLLSNTQFRTPNHLEDLGRMGFLEWLDALVFSIDNGMRKPAPEPFRDVLERLGVAPGRALMVGDSIEADIAGGRELGMTTALVRTPENANRAASGNHGADYVIDSVSELVGIVAQAIGWPRKG